MTGTEKKEVEINIKNHKGNSLLEKLNVFFRETLAIFIWLYAILKVFVFDIDNYLVNRFFPNYAWIVYYKFLVFLFIAAVFWLITKNSKIIVLVLFILFYPVILIFWKIPVFLLKTKSAVLTFALIDSVISFFKSLKFSFVTTSFYLVATAIVLNSDNKYVLSVSILVLVGILFLVYIQRLVFVFKKTGVYEIYIKFFSFVSDFAMNNPVYKIEEDTLNKSIDFMSEQEMEAWKSNVQQLVLYNRLFLFVSQKLKIYQEGGFNIVSSVIGLLVLVLYTSFTFSTINYGLFVINKSYYAVLGVPSFFTFFYYSFNVLLFNQIQELIPIAPISQAVSMLQSFFALFLVAILISLVFSIRSQRESDELKSTIEHLKIESKKLEDFIKNKYKLGSIEEAVEGLKKLKSTLIDWIFNLTTS